MGANGVAVSRYEGRKRHEGRKGHEGCKDTKGVKSAPKFASPSECKWHYSM